MRPGQLTPENLAQPWRRYQAHSRFNEAGAINPGKPTRTKVKVISSNGFNEAGAINPGKPVHRTGGFRSGDGFNEAGAINPGKRSRLFHGALQVEQASMRPGQLTPENSDGLKRRRCGSSRFNEAGAINPGKLQPLRILPILHRRFNEAGAINPGKLDLHPAHIRQAVACFNEAGAINPGKLLSTF